MPDTFTAPGVRKDIADALNALQPGDRFRVSVARGRWADAAADTYGGSYLGPVASGNGNISRASFAMSATRGPDGEACVLVVPAYLVRAVTPIPGRGSHLSAEYLGLTAPGARMAAVEDARALQRAARLDAEAAR